MVNMFERNRSLCEDCLLKLTRRRPGRRCTRCARIMMANEVECGDCRILGASFKPVGNITNIFDYNSEVKMLMHRYKFVRDIALAEVLSYFIKIKQRDYDLIVPIPISVHRLKTRGFNQITEVLRHAGIKYDEILSTDKVALQSELSKLERLNSANPFSFNNPSADVMLKDKRILIVDDIYTTGITVHHAAEVLFEYHPSSVDVLTFSKA